MKKNVVAAILIAAFSLLFLTSCWDRKELNELGIVMAVGFDKDSKTGRILLTSQIVRPGSLKKQQGGGKESPYDIVVTSGDTAFEAVRNTVKEFDRRSFFSHIKVIVVGETMAREGLSDIIDFISRTHEIRKFTWIVVTHGDEARKVLGVKHGIENVQANYMEGMIRRQNIDAEVTSFDVMDFIKKMQGEGINPATGVFNIINVESVPSEGVRTEPREGLALSGTAAFKKDKLVGFLNYNETRGLNFITGNWKSGVISLPSLHGEKRETSIEIKKVNSEIKPVMEGGKISFTIHIKAEGNITETGDATDVSKPEQIEKLNSEFTKFIDNNVNTAVIKIQKELQTDILGFGSAFERKYPKDWKTAKDQWDVLFPDVSYTVKVEASLKRTGMLLKPINAPKTDQ